MTDTHTVIYQLNLSPSLGGAEIFTAFFTRALTALGLPAHLVVSSKASYWQQLDLGQGEICSVGSEQAIADAIPPGAILIVHSSVPEPIAQMLAKRATLIAIAHQALYNDKSPAYYRYAHMLVPVSRYVIETLQAKGFNNVFATPLYGIGNLPPSSSSQILKGSLIYWDQRKLRDCALSKLEQLTAFLRPPLAYKKREGLTLGIVSRLADAKQFPTLLSHIAPKIKARPDVWVEVFGSAVGYRAFRDFKRAIAPISKRVRFWGMQNDVAAVYANIDYLLTGLPERESFGLNVVEAQLSGVPVLAPKALPFTETVIDQYSGYLYTDPRIDGGEDFARVLDLSIKTHPRPDPRLNATHLAQFEFPAFCRRVSELIGDLKKK